MTKTELLWQPKSKTQSHVFKDKHYDDLSVHKSAIEVMRWREHKQIELWIIKHHPSGRHTTISICLRQQELQDFLDYCALAGIDKPTTPHPQTGTTTPTEAKKLLMDALQNREG